MTKRLTGINSSLSYLGVNASQPSNFYTVDRAPTANDYLNYSLGDFWLDSETQIVYCLTNKDAQVATWSNFGGGSGVTTITTDSGTATVSGNNINVLGGSNVGTSGSGATVTIAIDASPTFTGPITIDGDVTINMGDLTVDGDTTIDGDLHVTQAIDAGTSITAGTTIEAGTTITAGDDIITTGGDLISETGGLTVKTGIQVEDFGAGVVQSDVDGNFFSDNGTNGQVLIGGGTEPNWANITSTGGSIVVTNGANTINIEASGSMAASYTTDSGSAVPALGILQILGGTGLSTTGTTNIVTVNLDTPVTVANGGTGASSLTDHGVLVGSGTAAVTPVAVGTNGQVLIGATGADPAFATLTSSGGTITFTPGANTLNLESTTLAAFTVTSINNASSPYTVLSTDQYISANCTAGTITIRLPNAPTTGKIYSIKDSAGLSASNNITVTTVGGVVTIDGSTTYSMNTNYQAINVLFNGTSYEVF